MGTGLVPNLNARTVTSFLVAVLLLVLAWPRALGGATSYVVISGISMQPMMETGDLAIVRRAGVYEVGDVIAFRTIDGDVIHRIIGGNGLDGYVTQGDNVAKPDPYRPTDDDVRGRRLFHIPNVGGVGMRITSAVSPLVLAAGAIVLLLVVPSGSKKRRRRVRRGRRGPAAGPELAEGAVDNDLLGRPRLVAAALCGVVALAVLPSAVVAWGTPTTLPVEAGGSHRLELAVTGIAGPDSTTYPSGRSDELAAGDALVRAELTSLEVVASYALDGAPGSAPATTGTIRVDALLTTREGESLPLDTGSGDAVSVAGRTLVELDLASAEAAFAALPEAGQDAIAALELRPEVVLDGTPGQTLTGEPLRLVFREGSLVAEGVTDTVVGVASGEAASARVGLLGITMRTSVVRWLGTLLLLVLGGAAAWLVRTELQDDPELGLALKHSSLLVELAPGAHVGGTEVRVASMDELTRMAKRDQRSVLHLREEDGSHRYMVPDGELTYTFVRDASPVPRVDTPLDAPLPRRWEVERADDVEIDSFDELAQLWQEPTADGVPGALERVRVAGGQVLYALLREGQRFTYLAGPDEPLRSTDRPAGSRRR